MAVSLSTNAVKLYSPTTGQYQGECKGHTDTINQIAFSNSLTPHVLHSCSSDGTIRAWDTRTFRQVCSSYFVSSVTNCLLFWYTNSIIEYFVWLWTISRCRVWVPVLLKRSSASHLEAPVIIFLLLGLNLRFCYLSWLSLHSVSFFSNYLYFFKASFGKNYLQ